MSVVNYQTRKINARICLFTAVTFDTVLLHQLHGIRSGLVAVLGDAKPRCGESKSDPDEDRREQGGVYVHAETAG